MQRKLNLWIAAAAMAVNCSAIASELTTAPGGVPAAGDAALHTDWMDKSADPLRDFFQYANGSFVRDNPVPPAYSSWGQFQILNQKNQDFIHQLLEAAALEKHASPGSESQKIGDFYASGMDESAVERAGIEPLKGEFARIDALKTPADLTAMLAHLQLIGVDALFGIGQMQDFADSTQVIGVVQQGGLGLPDRDYYLKDEPKFAAIRQAYEAHITRMLVLLGDAEAVAKTAAHEVMGLETRLATASMPSEDQRDPHAIYNMRDLAALAKAAPAIDWPKYLRAAGAPPVAQLNMAMPKFFVAASHEIETTPVPQWQHYLRWQLAHAYAPFLSKAFVEENFKLAQTVSGTKELLPRWRRVLSTEDSVLGFAVGHEYVQRRFPPEARAQVLEILHGVRGALRTDIQTLPWMGEATRAKALQKLDLIEERIGYPDVWRDYAKFKVDRGFYALNVMRGRVFDSERELAKIGKPVDRSEWGMVPQIINAYYDPSMNNINFPAGILQPPFFDPKAPAAFNYGAIGAVIGHEITHGFDDQGSQFDGHGNLVNWWSKEDGERFQSGVSCIADQYSAYVVDGDMHLKGKLVTGEAIADLGGVLLAYRAFQASPGYGTAPKVGGYTADQQFFLSFSRFWAESIRPEQARMYAATDPHPPARFRVDGTVANVPQFVPVFGGPPSGADPKRCVIW